MWLHGDSFVLCALQGRAALWHVGERCHTMIEVEYGKFKNASITHLAVWPFFAVFLSLTDRSILSTGSGRLITGPNA
jgi:hypothetical protein